MIREERDLVDYNNLVNRYLRLGYSTEEAIKLVDNGVCVVDKLIVVKGP
jgi:hypothetical protein